MPALPFALAAAFVLAAAAVPAAAAADAEAARNIATLKVLYERFNARDIDGVVANVSDDVRWANAMDGGYVEGRAGIRAYWTRQWSIANPHVEPLSFTPAVDGAIVVEVRQTIRDLDGNLVQVEGLRNKTVGHVFHFKDGKVVRFDVRDEG